MKTIIVISTLLFIILFGYTLMPQRPVYDPALDLQKRLLHEFIQYEFKFNNLNKFNWNPEYITRQDVYPKTFDNLVLDLSRESKDLRLVLDETIKLYPYTDELIQKVYTWLDAQEKVLVQRKYTEHWQVDLIRFQMQLLYVINDKFSSENLAILKDAAQYQTSLARDNKRALCALVDTFGETTTPTSLAKQMAAINLTKGACNNEQEAMTP